MTLFFLLFSNKKEPNPIRCGTTGMKSIAEAGENVKINDLSSYRFPFDRQEPEIFSIA
jgi:hypothetical protein